MRRRIAVFAATLLAVVTLSAGPAFAHFNDAAGKATGPPAHANVQGLGHAGMECGAENDTTPLQPLGLDCPAG